MIFGMFQKSLDLAVKLGLISQNVAKTVGNVKKGKQTVDFWTKEEFDKVIATFDKSNYYEHFSFVLIWSLFMTGMRFGEAQAIEWKDIDFENNTLTINKNMVYNSATDYYTKSPKTKAGNRVIALDKQTIDHLKEWETVQKKNVISKYVFSYSGLPIIKSTVKRILDRHSALAQVHRIRIHALRHSHASFLISLGVNAIVIRDRLGHEDIETTLGTYGHLYDNCHFEVADKLNSVLLNGKEE